MVQIWLSDKIPFGRSPDDVISFGSRFSAYRATRRVSQRLNISSLSTSTRDTAAMVHLRLNEKESNPNPHINFISALPTTDPSATEDARQLLRALAAQVRPVMKSNGFTVNSFEEVWGSQFLFM